MKRKIFMTICIIGAVLASTSMVFTTIAKQYTGSIFYLILFFINVFGFYATKNEAEPNKVTVLKKHFDDAHYILETQRQVLTDEYMKGMYNGMELILCTLEDREPIWASELDTNQKEEGNLNENHSRKSS
jgi:hypothetical protein